MSIEITMPRLSETMEEGTLLKWHVKVGEKISSGDVLADVEADKATIEIPSDYEGTVAKLLVQEDQTLSVGQLILLLAEEGESIDDVAASGDSKNAAPVAETSSAVDETPTPNIAAAPPSTTAALDKIKISPIARKIAEEHGLDLGTVTGSGPNGRIIKQDVLAAINQTEMAPVASPAASEAIQEPATVRQDQILPTSNMRKTIARRLVESKTTIPHFTVTISANMDPLIELRQTLNAQLESSQSPPIKLSVNDFIILAAAMALAQHPMINASWTDLGIQAHKSINIGVAVAIPQEKGGGLVVPTLHNVDSFSLRQIRNETKRLADKARGQGLSLQEMSGGTFTVSNLGMFGIEHFEAIINPPQAAILAVGAVIQKPVVRNDQVIIGHEMTCTLSADHRAIDGAMAAGFLGTLKQLLENPAAMPV